MKLPVVRLLPLLALLAAWCLTVFPVAHGAPGVAPAIPAPTTLSKEKPFKAVAGGPTQVGPGESFQLRYTIYLIDKDHYLYKERMSLQVKPAPGISYGEVKFSPAPEKKHDTFEDRDMEIYHVPVTLYVDAKVAPDAALGPRSIDAEVRYQGCNPSVCFFPTKEALTVKLEVGKKSAATTPAEGSTGEAGTVASGEPATATASAPAALEPVAAAPAAEPASADATIGDVADDAPVAAQETSPAEALAISAAASGSVPPSASSPAAATLEATDDITRFMEKGLVWAFLAVFGLGLLASFTPCIYPIIPITLRVLGARQARSKLHGFTLALVYVLGLSVVYTLLGVFAASTGALFGGLMQNKWVVGGIALMFIAMGFGMLGVFNVAMPSGITTRLSTVQGGRGYPGVFVHGAIAGLVASPCVGPLIVSLMTYIAKTGNVGLGSALMFTFALGMGQLFLVLGTFAVSMPKSGPWMDTVKVALSLLIFGVGLYYLQTVVPEGWYELLIGVSAVIAGTFVGAFHALNDESSTGLKVRKVAGLLFVTVGIYSVVGGLLTTGLVAPQLSVALRGGAGQANAPVAVAGIPWDTDFEGALTRAREKNAPVLIDFTAEWCAACKELEHKTYTDPRVISAAKEFVTVKVDGTDMSQEFEALRNRFNVKGMPTVLFLAPDGETIPELTVTGFVEAEDFLRRMCRVPWPQASRLTHVCRG